MLVKIYKDDVHSKLHIKYNIAWVLRDSE